MSSRLPLHICNKRNKKEHRWVCQPKNMVVCIDLKKKLQCHQKISGGNGDKIHKQRFYLAIYFALVLPQSWRVGWRPRQQWSWTSNTAICWDCIIGWGSGRTKAIYQTRMENKTKCHNTPPMMAINTEIRVVSRVNVLQTIESRIKHDHWPILLLGKQV